MDFCVFWWNFWLLGGISGFWWVLFLIGFGICWILGEFLGILDLELVFWGWYKMEFLLNLVVWFANFVIVGELVA